MGRKNRKIGRTYGEDTSVPCQEPIAHVKARVKTAKENLNDVVRLVDQGVFEYDIRDEIVGRAYMTVVQTKQELKRRKVRK